MREAFLGDNQSHVAAAPHRDLAGWDSSLIPEVPVCGDGGARYGTVRAISPDKPHLGLGQVRWFALIGALILGLASFAAVLAVQEQSHSSDGPSGPSRALRLQSGSPICAA